MKKQNPCDYEYRYAFKFNILDLKKDGWKECGFAGHYAGGNKVIFVRRKIPIYSTERDDYEKEKTLKKRKIAKN